MCAEREELGAVGADSEASGRTVAWASQRAPAVEQISDHGPLPLDGIIRRDSVGTSARLSVAINAKRSNQRRRSLKKFTARV